MPEKYAQKCMGQGVSGHEHPEKYKTYKLTSYLYIFDKIGGHRENLVRATVLRLTANDVRSP